MEENKLKDCYKAFLHTERGKELIGVSVKLKREWELTKKGKDITLNTENVKLNVLNKKLQSRFMKLSILPIGLNNMCHINADVFRCCGYESQVGFNLTACPCGKKMSYELHSVNKKNEKYFDFTRDFNNEKEKYFMPIKTSLNIYDLIELFGNNNYSVNTGCKCKINWSKNIDGVLFVNENEILELIDEMERIIGL